jgi:phosphoglycolate phosphatase
LKKITILFDLDGTLIDSTDAIVLSFLDVFEKFDFKKPSSNAIKKQIGHTLEDMFINLNVDKRYADKCVIEYKKFYMQRALEMTTLLPKAKESIIKASSFANIGIVTTKTGRYSKVILEHLEVMQYFNVLIGREDVIHPKPHGEPIEKALELMGSSKDNVWMIGDTRFDLLSAKNANVNSIGVLSGYAKEEELRKYTPLIKEDTFSAVTHLQSL